MLGRFACFFSNEEIKCSFGDAVESATGLDNWQVLAAAALGISVYSVALVLVGSLLGRRGGTAGVKVIAVGGDLSRFDSDDEKDHRESRRKRHSSRKDRPRPGQMSW